MLTIHFKLMKLPRVSLKFYLRSESFPACLNHTDFRSFLLLLLLQFSPLGWVFGLHVVSHIGLDNSTPP